MEKLYKVIFENRESIPCATFEEAVKKMAEHGNIGDSCFIVRGEKVLYHWQKPFMNYQSSPLTYEPPNNHHSL